MVHTGFRHGDTAALGRGARHLVLGDEVRCVPDPTPSTLVDDALGVGLDAGALVTGALHARALHARASVARALVARVPYPAVLPRGREAALTAVGARQPDARGVSRADLDFGIRMSTGGYLVVAAGRITAWTDTRDPGVPLFDDTGHPVGPDEPEPEPEAPLAPELSGYGPPSGCAVCAAVRSGGVERMRAEHRAELVELRRVKDEAKAIRRREALRPLPSWRTPD